MNIFGEKFRLSIFGESHGPAIGVVLDGVPAGFTPDFEFINSELARRAPGRSALSTPRTEADEIEILSGLFNGKATGAPLCAVIRNTNTRSKDYDPAILRPSHADYTAHVKYKGFSDYRGGGHFSGRITAPLVFAGAIAKQLLSKQGVSVSGRIVSGGGVTGDEEISKAILDAKDDLDSVGGIIECTTSGVPAGLGEPFFGSVESVIASMIFSIPAVKGIEFGGGFALADMRGSQANDEFFVENGAVKTRTNHNGGINGGITNGMPLVFRVAIKPTPSIGKTQRTVNIEAMQDCEINIQGRHDPCIVQRALPVIEAAAAVCIYDLWRRSL